MKNALVQGKQVWKVADFVMQVTASLKRERRVFTTEKSCIYNNSRPKIITDGMILLVSPTSLVCFLYFCTNYFFFGTYGKTNAHEVR